MDQYASSAIGWPSISRIGPDRKWLSVVDDTAHDFIGGYRIDRDSPVPAYYQLQDWLTQRIESGDLVPGTRLPTERDLTQFLGISRSTLRQALDRLARDGLLERRQGAGSFVASPRFVGEIGAVRGLSVELADQGSSSETAVLGVEWLVAPPNAREALEIPAAGGAIRVRRVRSVEGTPLSFETSWLHGGHCMPILSIDLTGRSLNQVLTEHCGLDLDRAVERITATVTDEFESEQLQVPLRTPAFRVQRTTWTTTGQAVEFVTSVVRGDRFSFEATLGRHGTSERTPTLAQEQE